MFQQGDIKLQPFTQAFAGLFHEVQKVLEISLEVFAEQGRFISGHFLQLVLELHRPLDFFLKVLERCFLQVMETRFYPLQHTVVNFQCLA